MPCFCLSLLADWTFLFYVIDPVWIPNYVLVLISLWLKWIFKTNQIYVCCALGGFCGECIKQFSSLFNCDFLLFSFLRRLNQIISTYLAFQGQAKENKTNSAFLFFVWISLVWGWIWVHYRSLISNLRWYDAIMMGSECGYI